MLLCKQFTLTVHLIFQSWIPGFIHNLLFFQKLPTFYSELDNYDSVYWVCSLLVLIVNWVTLDICLKYVWSYVFVYVYTGIACVLDTVVKQVWNL